MISCQNIAIVQRSQTRFWTSDKFMDTWKSVEDFYGNIPTKMAVDTFGSLTVVVAVLPALDVPKTNVKPGVKQRIMRIGWWGGKLHLFTWAFQMVSMYCRRERRNTNGRDVDKMKEILGSHPDFKHHEKSRVE